MKNSASLTTLPTLPDVTATIQSSRSSLLHIPASTSSHPCDDSPSINHDLSSFQSDGYSDQSSSRSMDSDRQEEEGVEYQESSSDNHADHSEDELQSISLDHPQDPTSDNRLHQWNHPRNDDTDQEQHSTIVDGIRSRSLSPLFVSLPSPQLTPTNHPSSNLTLESNSNEPTLVDLDDDFRLDQTLHQLQLQLRDYLSM